MNKYYQKENKTTPYCYSIKHKISGIYYYGSRTCKWCHPNDLWVDYFTSSKLIHDIIENEGKEIFEIKIRKVFKTKKDCLLWEQKFLNKVNASNNQKFYNRDNMQQPHKVMHLNIDTIFISNLELDKCIRWPKEKEIPINWIKGTIHHKGDINATKRKWWHDPITLKAAHLENCPEGYISGRGLGYISNSQTLKKKKSLWYTNGIESKLINENEIPPKDWKRGMTHKTKPTGKKHHEYIWIHNEYEKRQIIKDTPIPEGWNRGAGPKIKKPFPEQD